MILSKSGEYALLALLHLADQPDDTPVRGADIAAELDVPANYLSKLLHQLARAGLVVSERGPQGGFRLAAAPGEIRLADILEAVEPARLDRRCLLGHADCTDADPCPVHDRWRSVADPSMLCDNP